MIKPNDLLNLAFIIILSVIIGIGCSGGGNDGENGIPAEVIPEAEATIGPEGGTVEVTNPDSPLYGVKVTFPEGALLATETVSILLPSDVPVLPDEVFANGPAVQLKRTGTSNFNEAILVEIPVDEHPGSEEYLDVMHYNEDADEWESVTSWYAYEEMKMICATYHFSPFSPVQAKMTSSSELPQNSDFSLASDAMYYQNDLNVDCSGITGFTEWYYNEKKNSGSGLKCYYDETRGEIVSIAASDPVWILLGPKIISYGMTFNKIILALSDKKVISLGVAKEQNIFKDPIVGHQIVVYRWDPAVLPMWGPAAVPIVDPLSPTPSAVVGKFTCYNPNNNEDPWIIEVKRTLSGLLPVYTFEVLGYPDYKNFELQNVNYSTMSSIYNTYPPNGTCYCKDEDDDGFPFRLQDENDWNRSECTSDCNGTDQQDCACSSIDQSGCDCKDKNTSINPGAIEIPDDGIDNNCDGQFNDYTNSFGMTFKPIPADTFIMGSPPDELGRRDDETQHQVTLTQSFYMQTTEVTQAQWETVMGDNPSFFSDCPNCPVEYVSWNDVQDFITTLNAMGEGTYGLPTEAQWEYAARAGSTTAFTNGDISSYWWECTYDENLDEVGWYCDNSNNKTHEVAQKNSNAWGLYDIHGNVREWCNDRHSEYPSSPVTDPTGPSYSCCQTVRGGSFEYQPSFCRLALRGGFLPDYRVFSIGFRLIKTP